MDEGFEGVFIWQEHPDVNFNVHGPRSLSWNGIGSVNLGASYFNRIYTVLTGNVWM